jgi:Protein of unknown function, DUF547
MKALSPWLLLWSICAGMMAAASAENLPWVSDYNRLLGKYVTTNGVKYAEWKQNKADVQALQQVIDAIAQEKVSSLGEKDQLAFYLNAYNAWILHEAIAKYPTKSIKDLLFTFFTSKRIKVAGEQTSFNDLEKQTIRSKFSNPNVHFALNCASRSCPPLNPEAFEGGKLDQQFKKLSTAFVNSEQGVNYQADKNTAELSKIFDWYKGDFKDGALKFINERRAKPLRKDVKISYQDYNWSLNDAQ